MAESSFSLFGKVSTASTVLDYAEGLLVNSKCFNGIAGLTTCKNTNVDDPTAFSKTMPYYYTFNQANDRLNTPFCAQCCGNSDSRIDEWSFQCRMDSVSAKLANTYGSEFRFLVKTNAADDVSEILRCPIWRTGCTYNGLVATKCNKNDGKFLTGYILKLRISQRNKDFVYWRGVDSCSVQTFESNTTLARAGTFHETIIMDYNPTEPVQVDDARIFFLFLFSIVFAAAALYCFRRQTCIVCQKRLILCVSRCCVCRAMGARVDPVLIAALADKGRVLQGFDSQSVLGGGMPVFPTRKIRVVPIRSSSHSMESAVGPVGPVGPVASARRFVWPRLGLPLYQASARSSDNDSSTAKAAKDVSRAVMLKAIDHPFAQDVLGIKTSAIAIGAEPPDARRLK